MTKRPRRPLQVELLEARDLLDAALAAEVFHIQGIPNDTSFATQWALHNTGQNGGVVDADIDAPEAWDVVTGSMNTVVAVIDTGIDYRHVDLYRNIWLNQGEIPSAVRAQLLDTDGDGRITFWDLNDVRNQGAGKITDLNGNNRIDAGDVLKPSGQGGWANGVSDDGDGFIDDLIGWDFVNNDNDPLDDHNHGTHVSGMIGATGQDGQGVAGVAWKVSLMAVKSLSGTGGGAPSSIVAGLNYAVDHGAAISNNSYGGDNSFNQDMYNAIDAARARGHIYVVSAGNGGSDLVGDNVDVTPDYPASYNLGNVVSVAATTRNNARYAPSNYGGKTIDLGAPGRDILSTLRNDSYASWSGTSMAAPFVSGVLALVRSQHPAWSYFDVVDQVLSTVDKTGALSGRVITNGRLNAYKAVSTPRADRTGPSVVSMAANASGANPVSAVRVSFSEAINAASFTLDDIRSFTGPNGAVASTRIDAVANTDGRVFDVVFAPQSAAGSYRLEIGPDIRDTSGNALDQDRDGVLGELADDTSSVSFVVQPIITFTNSTALFLRDRATSISSLVINQDVTIADLNVRLNIRHTFNNDLYIQLRGPDGTAVVLVNRRGGSGDNFTNTLLDDEATTWVVNGAAPFAGSYRPELPLTAFDGKNARGTWQLIIEDRQGGDTGTLNNWSLIVESGGTFGAASVEADSSVTPSSTAVTQDEVVLPLGEEPRQPQTPLPTRSRRDEAQTRRQHVIDQVFTSARSERWLWSTARAEDAPGLEDVVRFFRTNGAVGTLVTGGPADRP